jgi:hypothetical protein
MDRMVPDPRTVKELVEAEDGRRGRDELVRVVEAALPEAFDFCFRFVVERRVLEGQLVHPLFGKPGRVVG